MTDVRVDRPEPLHHSVSQRIRAVRRGNEDDVALVTLHVFQVLHEESLERIRALTAAGIVSRIGIILRHRALGWRSNAMVVWQVPEQDIERAGGSLAAAPGVTLCYQRRTDPDRWPYNLYCMIHARSRNEALTTLGHAAANAGLATLPHRVLFSVRCFKQTGAMVQAEPDAAA